MTAALPYLRGLRKSELLGFAEAAGLQECVASQLNVLALFMSLLRSVLFGMGKQQH